MRNYLVSFFKEYGYNANDVAYLLEIYDDIVRNEEATALLNKALAMYDENIDCDFKSLIEIADEIGAKLYLQEYSVEFLLLVCLSKRTKQLYAERQLGEEIFSNTMFDLKYKLEECKLVKGVIGTFVPNWFGGFFRLKRFALGRLQFEVIPFGRTYEKDGKKLSPESKVINIHIPRTLTPIDEKSCDISFQRAKSFFADEIGDVCAFVCGSWLLYPENKDILPKHTNTYQFMQRFEIISFEYKKDCCDLWRLFDTEEKNINKLPADSSVRRAYIKHLKEGGKVGTGFGVFFL